MVTWTPVPCTTQWFTSKATPDSCPIEPPAQLEAAYEPFEHGALLWRKGRGYIILPFDPATSVQSGVISFWPDKETIYRDTSGDVTPPAGLYAPASGFGYLWRGDFFPDDMEDKSWVRTTLGWATTPETGYTITEQSGTRLTLIYQGNPISTQELISYFTLPNGHLLSLSRLALPNQPTSLLFMDP